MTLKDEVREIIEPLAEWGHKVDKEIHKDIDQATEAIMDKIRERVRENGKYKVGSGDDIKPVIWNDEVVGYASGDYEKGYNQALDDLLTEMGGTK